MIEKAWKTIAYTLGLCLLLVSTSQAQQLLPGEQPAQVTAISGVVAEGAQWNLIWADFATADGIVGTADGGVLFAQEQTDKIIKLTVDNQQFTYAENTNAAGAVSLDSSGRLYTVERACTEPLNLELGGCNELTRVVMLTPEYKLLANSFSNGQSMGRLNDLIADGKGGVYFTVGGVYYVNAEGVVNTVTDQNIFSNGIMLSPNGETLYVTNNTVVLAFDVAADGSTSNRRDFASLNGDGGGDGMAVDSEGRLYVTANAGVHVLAEDGAYLGLIPTPRRAITIAFSGPDKRTLYVPQMGVVGPDGQAWSTPEGIRNAAMSIYTLDMQAQGFLGRPK